MHDRAGAAGSDRQAVRASGDVYPTGHDDRRMCIAGVLLAFASLWHMPWLFRVAQPMRAPLPYAFAAANAFTVAARLLTIANPWERRIPDVLLQPVGDEPLAGVIAPPQGDPASMVLRTVVSVLELDRSGGRIVIVVSDDGQDPSLAGRPVHYVTPPQQNAPGREGRRGRAT